MVNSITDVMHVTTLDYIVVIVTYLLAFEG